MKEQSAVELAAWLAENQPALFAELEKNAAIAGARLNGITDFLKSVGSSVSTGVANVAKFLTSNEGLATVGTLGTAYLANRSQQNVLQTQVALAQAGQSLAPIQTAYGANGQPISIDARTGMPITSQNIGQYGPSFLAQWGLPLGIGAGLFLLLTVLRK